MREGRLHYLITLLLLFVFFRLGILTEVLQKLSLSQWEVHYGMLMLILLSLINVRLLRIRPPEPPTPISAAQPTDSSDSSDNSDSPPPSPSDRVTISINLGGAVLPLFFGLYVSREQPLELLPLLGLICLVALVVYPFSRVSKRRGVVIHLGGAILVAAIGAIWLGGEHYLVWAYLAAVMGTLIGGDLLHLSQLMRLRSSWRKGVFIGGAGLMDAIFLSGVFSMLTAELLQQHDLLSALS